MAKLSDLPPEIHLNIARHVISAAVVSNSRSDHPKCSALAALSEYWAEIIKTAVTQRLNVVEGELRIAQDDYESSGGGAVVNAAFWYIQRLEGTVGLLRTMNFDVRLWYEAKKRSNEAQRLCLAAEQD